MSDVAPPRRTRFRRLTLEEIRAVVGLPDQLAVEKIAPTIGETARRFIAHSPFMALATAGADGRADCSPRGDGPGFVKVLDERTIAIPDRTGNNLVDSFRNVLKNPGVGTLFFIPGLRETLRVNGQGYVTDDAELLARFHVGGRAAKLALVVDVEEVYLHCGKALIRSALWDPAQQSLAEAMTRGVGVFSLQQIERGRLDEHGSASAFDAWIEQAYARTL